MRNVSHWGNNLVFAGFIPPSKGPTKFKNPDLIDYRYNTIDQGIKWISHPKKANPEIKYSSRHKFPVLRWIDKK